MEKIKFVDVEIELTKGNASDLRGGVLTLVNEHGTNMEFDSTSSVFNGDNTVAVVRCILMRDSDYFINVSDLDDGTVSAYYDLPEPEGFEVGSLVFTANGDATKSYHALLATDEHTDDYGSLRYRTYNHTNSARNRTRLEFRAGGMKRADIIDATERMLDQLKRGRNAGELPLTYGDAIFKVTVS